MGPDMKPVFSRLKYHQIPNRSEPGTPIHPRQPHPQPRAKMRCVDEEIAKTPACHSEAMTSLGWGETTPEESGDGSGSDDLRGEKPSPLYNPQWL